MSFTRKIGLVSSFLILSWTSLVFAAEVVAEPVARVAKIGSILITQTDVDARAQAILPMQVSFHGSLDAEKIEEIKQEALNSLVERAYKVQFAIDEEVSIDAIDFENEWLTKQRKNPQMAHAKSSQLSKFRAELYLDLLARKAETVAVDEKISVTDQDVSDYYTKNKESYYRPKLFTASHVFVKVEPEDNAEEQETKRIRAEELYKRAMSGEDFYNLAYYESDDRSKYVGGSLGAFHAGQTVPEFDAAIHAMKPGDIVGPIRTMYGFHVIKLDSLDDERQLQFDEVSTKIRARLEKSEREQIYEQWMSQLKEKYPLERFER